MRLFNRFDVLEDKFNKDGSFNLTLAHSLNTTNITLKVPMNYLRKMTMNYLSINFIVQSSLPIQILANHLVAID